MVVVVIVVVVIVVVVIVAVVIVVVVVIRQYALCSKVTPCYFGHGVTLTKVILSQIKIHLFVMSTHLLIYKTRPSLVLK